jgi:O-antigen/teichoic acid export membrane protein
LKRLLKKKISINLIKSFFRKKVIKDLLSVAGFNFALKPIQIFRSFIVAKYLGPSEYGILASLQLIQMLNKYGNLGFNTTAGREAGHALGTGSLKEAAKIKNTAYSAEIILSFMLFIIGLSSSLFFDSKVVSILIVLASSGLLGEKLRAIIATDAVIDKRFILISKVTFFSSLLGSIIIIISVPFLKIYAVLLTNVLVSCFAIIFFLKYRKFRFSFYLDKKELKRLLAISIPLAINTLALGSFKYAERILIMSFLGAVSLGIFSFGTMIVAQCSIILKSGARVRLQDIYEGIANKDFRRIHNMVLKETFLVFLVSIIVIPIVGYFLGIFIPIFLEKWVNGVYSAKLYLLILPFEIILLYPQRVLISSLLNRQTILTIFRFGITGLLLIFTFTVHYLGILTLNIFIILNVACVAIYNIIVIYLYIKYFYFGYVKMLN